MKTLVVCGQSRSGTSLLCELLTLNGLGCPDEWLNATLELADEQRPAVLREVVAGHTQRGIFAVKATHELYRVWQPWLSPTHHILIWRENTVRQAISTYRATRTNRWGKRDDSPEPQDLDFDAAAILELKAYIESETTAYRRLLDGQGGRTLRLRYEDLLTDAGKIQTVRQCAACLDEPLPEPVNLGVSLKQQPDDLTDRWEQQLRAMLTDDSEYARQFAG